MNLKRVVIRINTANSSLKRSGFLDMLNAAFGFMPTALCCIFKIIAAIVICVSLGLLFFISETKLRGAFKKKTT